MYFLYLLKMPEGKMQNTISKESTTICTLFAHGLNLVAHSLLLVVEIAHGHTYLTGVTETWLVDFFPVARPYSLTHCHSIMIALGLGQIYIWALFSGNHGQVRFYRQHNVKTQPTSLIFLFTLDELLIHPLLMCFPVPVVAQCSMWNRVWFSVVRRRHSFMDQIYGCP